MRFAYYGMLLSIVSILVFGATSHVIASQVLANTQEFEALKAKGLYFLNVIIPEWRVRIQEEVKFYNDSNINPAIPSEQLEFYLNKYRNLVRFFVGTTEGLRDEIYKSLVEEAKTLNIPGQQPESLLDITTDNFARLPEVTRKKIIKTLQTAYFNATQLNKAVEIFLDHHMNLIKLEIRGATSVNELKTRDIERTFRDLIHHIQQLPENLNIPLPPKSVPLQPVPEVQQQMPPLQQAIPGQQPVVVTIPRHQSQRTENELESALQQLLRHLQELQFGIEKGI